MLGDQQHSAVHEQLVMPRPHIAALPLPVQKIRTVELDGKVIKLQIVSADPGGCRGWQRAAVAPTCACMRDPLAPASGMHACCCQLDAVHQTRTGHWEVVALTMPRRYNVVCWCLLVFAAALRSGTQLGRSASAPSPAVTTVAHTASS